MTSSARPPTTLLHRLLLSAGAVVVALVLCELALRVVGPSPARRTQADYGFLQADLGEPVLVFPPRGVVRYQWDGDPFGVLPEGARLEVALNDAGLRGPLPDGPAPRVLFVGDSFVFGEGVTDDATLPVQLAARAAPAFSAINAGVPGYGTREQWLRFPSWLADFRPRAVVMVFVLNDPISLSDSIAQDDRFMHVESADGTSRILSLFESLRADAGNESWYRDYYVGARRDAWSGSLARIRQMHELAQRQGVQFGVVVFPLLHRLGSYPFADLHELVATDLRGAQIPVLDLLPAFEGQDTEAMWVHPTDHHPNAAAHALAAGAMDAFVEELLAR